MTALSVIQIIWSTVWMGCMLIFWKFTYRYASFDGLLSENFLYRPSCNPETDTCVSGVWRQDYVRVVIGVVVVVAAADPADDDVVVVAADVRLLVVAVGGGVAVVDVDEVLWSL